MRLQLTDRNKKGYFTKEQATTLARYIKEQTHTTKEGYYLVITKETIKPNIRPYNHYIRVVSQSDINTLTESYYLVGTRNTPIQVNTIGQGKEDIYQQVDSELKILVQQGYFNPQLMDFRKGDRIKWYLYTLTVGDITPEKITVIDSSGESKEFSRDYFFRYFSRVVTYNQ